METVLFVLKIAGITLGVLLALLLLLLLLAVFCHVRYDVAVDADDTIRGRVRARWLWFVVRFSVLYEDGDTRMVLRILGIPIRLGKKKPRKKTREKKSAGKERKRRNEKTAQGESVSGSEDVRAGAREESTQVQDGEEQTETSKAVEDSRTSMKDGEEQSESLGVLRGAKFFRVCKKIFAKIRGIWLKIRAVFDTIRNIGKKTAAFLRELPDLLRSMHRKKDAVVSFLCDGHVRAFVGLSKTQLGCLLAHIKPREVQGYVRFGTGDACSTGQALGAAAVLFPLYASWLTVEPEFEEKHFSGYLKAKGKIQLFRVILIGKRWFMAETSRRCLNKWKRLKEELTNGR